MSSSHKPEDKARKVEELKTLIQKYDAVGIASLHKVRAPQLQELRRKLQENAHLAVAKNTMMKRAIKGCEDKSALEKIKEHLRGSNIFLFTNLNPFKLALLLEKGRVKTTARAGDVAANDVKVPAGNTGLPPGPIISQFGSVGLPTRIEAGNVWISRDTLVAEEGETISAGLASVLSKLGIKPVEVGLSLKAAYDDGLILTEEQLQLDLEGFQRTFQEAYLYAFNLTLNAAYPLPENIILLLQGGHKEAYDLALNAGVPSPDIIANLIRRAHMETQSLSLAIS